MQLKIHKEFTLKKFPFQIYTIDNCMVIDLQMLWYIFTNIVKLDAKIYKLISNNNIKKFCERGRKSKRYITPDGFRELMQKTVRLSVQERIYIIKEFEKQSFITSSSIDYRQMFCRQELEFLFTLQEALKEFELTLTIQQCIGSYIVDGVIKEKNIVIEYDENKHQSYSKDLEIERENAIEEAGYKIFRVTDDISLGGNLGKIIKHILTY